MNSASAPLVGARVLIVEDDARLARRLRMMLSRSGVSTESCMQLSPALTRAAGSSFDAALVDLGLPDGDGETLVRALCQAAQPTASVVLSGNADLTRARIALAGGAVDYLLKPTDFDTVRHALARAVRASRNARAALARLGPPDRNLEPTVQAFKDRNRSAAEGSTDAAQRGRSPRPGIEHIIGELSLSPRQGEVLRLLAVGLTNEAIAKSLQISLSAVKFHLARIYLRTGLSRHALLHRLANG